MSEDISNANNETNHVEDSNQQPPTNKEINKADEDNNLQSPTNNETQESPEQEEDKPKRSRSLGEIRIARFLDTGVSQDTDLSIAPSELRLLETPPFADTRSAEKWLLEQIESKDSPLEEGQYTIIRIVKSLNIEIARTTTYKVTEI